MGRGLAVEGSVTTAHDVERIREIRRQCRYLVTIGACATAGGIQALRNWANVDDFIRQVYATLIHGWLGADATAVLGQAFPTLDMFRS